MHRRELLASCDEHLGVGRGDPLRADSREAGPIGPSTGVAGRGRGDYGSPASPSRSLALASRRGCGRVVGRNRRIGFERLHTLRALASSEPASFEGVRLAAGCADPAGAFAADTTDYGRIARMTSVKAARNLTP